MFPLISRLFAHKCFKIFVSLEIKKQEDVNVTKTPDISQFI